MSTGILTSQLIAKTRASRRKFTAFRIKRKFKISNLTFSSFSLCCLLISGFSSPSQAEWSNSDSVHIVSGNVQGTQTTNDDNEGVWAWKGIPYAEPPLGELRWRAPIDPTPWQDIKLTDQYQSACPQFEVGTTHLIGSEDCLYLNIWRPQSEAKNLPVFVYLPGGGNSLGDAAWSLYNGKNIVTRSNVIFVTFNYRTGPLGFFSHGKMRTGKAEDKAADSGNYLLLDQIKALRWLKQNIEQFGGDPGNITVAGTSGCGQDIIALLMSPLATGSFDKAIINSPVQSAYPVWMADLYTEFGYLIPKMILASGGASDLNEAKATFRSWSGEQTRDFMRTVPLQNIFDAYSLVGDVPFLMILPIYADGHVIVKKGLKSFIDGDYPNKVPVIIGTTGEEWRQWLTNRIPNRNIANLSVKYHSDLWKADVDQLVKKMTYHPEQPPVYVYRFDWGAYQEDGSSPLKPPHDFETGAAHGMADMFIISSPEKLWTADAKESHQIGLQALHSAVNDYVTAFLYTGDPNATRDTTLPEWKPWNLQAGEPKTIVLDAGAEQLNIRTINKEFRKDETIKAMRELEFPLNWAVSANVLFDSVALGWILPLKDFDPD